MRRLHSENTREGPVVSAIRSLAPFCSGREFIGIAVTGALSSVVLFGTGQTFADDEQLLEIIDPMVQPADAITQERTEYTEIEVVEELVERQTVEAGARRDEQNVATAQTVAQPVLITPANGDSEEKITAVVIEADLPGSSASSGEEFVLLEAAPLPEQTSSGRSARQRSSSATTPARRGERSTVESIDFTPMNLQALAGVGIAGGLDAPDFDTDSDAPIFESPITDEQRDQLRKYDTREDLGRFNIQSEFRLRPEPVSISGRTYNYDYIISTPR